MSYCIEDEAKVCFCKTEKIDEYLEAMKECTELECYCKKHMPGS